MIEEHW